MRCLDVDTRAAHCNRPVRELDLTCAVDLASFFFRHPRLDRDRCIDGDRFAEIDVHIHDRDVIACAPDRHADDLVQDRSRRPAVNMTFRSLLLECQFDFGENVAVFASVPGQPDAVRIRVAADVAVPMWGDGG